MTTYEKFKLSIISIFSVALMVILYNYSENGRYNFHNQEQRAIIDTRSGTVYWLPGLVKYELKDFKVESKKKATN